MFRPVSRSSAQGLTNGKSHLLLHLINVWRVMPNPLQDLTRITMPATINEPTSTLQR
jgi:hypothetical protein